MKYSLLLSGFIWVARLWLPIDGFVVVTPSRAVTKSLGRRSFLLSPLQALPPAISLENLSCSHNGGETWQLQEVTYVLPRGAKIALVGRNGSGKSTLLRIMAENTCPDTVPDQGIKYTGKVMSPRTVRVAYVEQEPPMPADVSVADALFGIRGTGDSVGDNAKSIYATVRRYRLAAANAENDPKEFSAASALMDASEGGWDVLTKAEEIATKLRVRHLQDQPLSKLSGGERKRVALAAALVQQPDVLLLDEPTNFLSLAGVQWLSDLLLSDKKLTILMVTHDRAFLDEVCDRILELDQGKLYEYTGKYADYLEGKADRLILQDAAIQSARTKLRVELDWMRRQPQARQTKSKSRIEAFYKLQKATKPRPRDPSLNLLENDSTSRIGGKILSMRNINLKFGDRVMLDDFSYDFCRGDRICLVGANGVGKTTFVRVLTGELAPDSGEVEVGDTIKLGVYDQLGLTIDDPEQTLLNFVFERVRLREPVGANSEALEAVAPEEARRLLRKFEFPRERWNERISILSGGEKRRLQMLAVLSQRPNFLVMDEPSVDCDLDTLQALETYLQEEYDGVLLIVSHDRLFADKVSDHLFVFQGDGRILDYAGSLSEYASTLVDLENDRIQNQNFGDDSIVDFDSKKIAYKEDRSKRNEQRNTIRKAKKDLASVEKALEQLKDKAASLQRDIDTSTQGWSVLAELTDKLQKVNEEIDAKETKWLELAEVVEEAEVEV